MKIGCSLNTSEIINTYTASESLTYILDSKETKFSFTPFTCVVPSCCTKIDYKIVISNLTDEQHPKFTSVSLDQTTESTDSKLYSNISVTELKNNIEFYIRAQNEVNQTMYS